MPSDGFKRLISSTKRGAAMDAAPEKVAVPSPERMTTMLPSAYLR